MQPIRGNVVRQSFASAKRGSTAKQGQRENLIAFPRNPTTVRTFDFGPFLGAGFDEIALALRRQVQRFLEGKDRRLQTPSIVTICRLGMVSFLRFLTAEVSQTRRVMGLKDIDRLLVEKYVHYLRQNVASLSARRRTLSTVKTVLTSMSSRGLIRPEDLHVPNAFPRASQDKRLALEPYSRQELRVIAQALRDAVSPIFEPRVEITGELLSYCVLAIALRTGQNLTPLLELSPDCLRPHFKDGLKLLILEKRRSYKNLHVTVPASKADAVGVMPDTVRIIERVRELTQEVRDHAPQQLRDRLFVFRSRAHPIGLITALTASLLTITARRLEVKYDARDASGSRLRINVTRMRKTFVNRIYEVTRGDLDATAVAAGHTAQVTDSHYLVPDASAEMRWRFMGEMLSSELASGALAEKRTPLGHCRDSRRGEYSPKDGRACTSFLNCVRCRDYVVTADDLYKLYSFYWRVVAEREKVESRVWHRRFAVIIRTIDRDIVEPGLERGIFNRGAVASAKERARSEPHPYWNGFTILENPDE